MENVVVDKLYFGGDIGHGYVKTEQVMFPSKVKVGKGLGFGSKKKDTFAVNYKGQDYIVGDGAMFTGDERYFTDAYKIALLTAIALNNPTEDFIETIVVIGTPIERIQRVSKRIVEYYKDLQEIITVEGREVTIRITDIDVFIEGAYPVLTGDTERVITIDMGAGTINVTEFNNKVVENYATYNDAMYRLYQEVATYLNVEHGGDFKPTDIEPILNRANITINQQKVDITGIRPIIDSNIGEMASLIKNKFNVGRADKICLIGGGSKDTFQYWKKYFPTGILVDDSQNINYKVFTTVAKGMAIDE
ncbi:hypothetical protein GNF82_12070 [Clostridium perfringens]